MNERANECLTWELSCADFLVGDEKLLDKEFAAKFVEFGMDKFRVVWKNLAQQSTFGILTKILPKFTGENIKACLGMIDTMSGWDEKVVDALWQASEDDVFKAKQAMDTMIDMPVPYQDCLRLVTKALCEQIKAAHAKLKAEKDKNHLMMQAIGRTSAAAMSADECLSRATAVTVKWSIATLVKRATDPLVKDKAIKSMMTIVQDNLSTPELFAFVEDEYIDAAQGLIGESVKIKASAGVAPAPQGPQESGTPPGDAAGAGGGDAGADNLSAYAYACDFS